MKRNLLAMSGNASSANQDDHRQKAEAATAESLVREGVTF